VILGGGGPPDKRLLVGKGRKRNWKVGRNDWGTPREIAEKVVS